MLKSVEPPLVNINEQLHDEIIDLSSISYDSQAGVLQFLITDSKATKEKILDLVLLQISRLSPVLKKVSISGIVSYNMEFSTNVSEAAIITDIIANPENLSLVCSNGRIVLRASELKLDFNDISGPIRHGYLVACPLFDFEVTSKKCRKKLGI